MQKMLHEKIKKVDSEADETEKNTMQIKYKAKRLVIDEG